MSYLEKKHGGAKDNDEYDTNLETIDRLNAKDQQPDSDEEDLLNTE